MASSPASSRRKLEIEALPMVMAGLPLLVESTSPKGKPKTYTGIISASACSSPERIGAGVSATSLVLRMAKSTSGSAVTTSAWTACSFGVPL